MIDHQLIKKLQERLKKPLPGLNAQIEMASRSREKGWMARKDHRESGVLLFLYPMNDKWHITFMKRTEDEGVHSGQISFPGGRKESGDIDFIQTALREAEEEFSIPASDVTVIGKLTELYIPPSNFMVYPTVGYMCERPRFIPDPAEVAEVLEVELDYLLKKDIQAIRQINVGKNLKVKAPSFLVDSHIIWGATAMILNEFLHLLRELY